MSEWIRVEDKLPATGEKVIVYRPTAESTQDQPVRVVRYTGHMRTSWQGVEHGFECICHPTHWMPLPAAPK